MILVSFRLEPDMKAALEALAAKQDRPNSQVIRHAIASYLAQNAQSEIR